MPLFSFEGKSPRVHPTAFIAPTANLIGDVTVEENASVWYKSVPHLLGGLRTPANRTRSVRLNRGSEYAECYTTPETYWIDLR